MIPAPVFQLLWLGYAYFVVTRITRYPAKIGYKLAAWVVAAELYSIILTVIIGHGFVPDATLLLFVISGGIAGRAISEHVDQAMHSARDVIVVSLLGLAFTGIFILSLYGWATIGSPETKAWAAIGMVGMIALPSSAWGRLIAYII